MSSVLPYYADRMEPLTLESGGTEMALVTRRGKSQSPRTIADAKSIAVELDTSIAGGDIVTRANGESYFIIAKQYSADCVSMQGRRINAYVELIDVVEKYANHKKVGLDTTTLASNLPVYYQDISASMREHDAGLLPNTVKKFIMKSSVPIAMFHRIVLNGHEYQVDNIDTGKYVGLYEVQCSEDTRK